MLKLFGILAILFEPTKCQVAQRLSLKYNKQKVEREPKSKQLHVSVLDDKRAHPKQKKERY